MGGFGYISGEFAQNVRCFAAIFGPPGWICRPVDRVFHCTADVQPERVLHASDQRWHPRTSIPHVALIDSMIDFLLARRQSSLILNGIHLLVFLDPKIHPNTRQAREAACQQESASAIAGLIILIIFGFPAILAPQAKNVGFCGPNYTAAKRRINHRSPASIADRPRRMLVGGGGRNSGGSKLFRDPAGEGGFKCNTQVQFPPPLEARKICVVKPLS